MQMKHRKALASGKSASGDKSHISIGDAGVLVTGPSRSLVFLPKEICRVPIIRVARRTKGRKAMTRQKSDCRVVPQSLGNLALTEAHLPTGGKAAAVNQQAKQPELCSDSAEFQAATAVRSDVEVKVVGHRCPSTANAEPQSEHKVMTASSATMEVIAAYLWIAFQNVASNKGAPGPDKQSIDQVRKHWPELSVKLRKALLDGSYMPGDIRRVWIPKASGGQRGLGIPNVVDRVVQEAVRLAIELLYEPTFHPASHGFRPGRSCHTAIALAKRYLDEGYEWVVDIDLEKFFDKVNHQRLMARLAQRIHDRRVLVLIGRMLKAKVVLPDGVVVNNEEGVPQGGPLSPLLSNIVLDELDRELARRNHKFVRYADDCNIYVRSERAGQRVMASVTDFLKRRMRLTVNVSKSAVARPEKRHFLGFRLRLRPQDDSAQVLISKRTQQRLDDKTRELTPRNWGNSLRECIRLINVYIVGWVGFFAICTESILSVLKRADAHIRRRLRAIVLKHWKRQRTIARKLIGLGVRPRSAWRGVYGGHKSIWALSHSGIVDRGLCNKRFAQWGLLSLEKLWRERFESIAAPAQLVLPLG